MTSVIHDPATRRYQPGDPVTVLVDVDRILAFALVGEQGTVHGYTTTGQVEVRLGDGQLHTLWEHEIAPADVDNTTDVVNPLEPTAADLAAAIARRAAARPLSESPHYVIGAVGEALRIAASADGDERNEWIRYARATLAASDQQQAERTDADR